MNARPHQPPLPSFETPKKKLGTPQQQQQQQQQQQTLRPCQLVLPTRRTRNWFRWIWPRPLFLSSHGVEFFQAQRREANEINKKIRYNAINAGRIGANKMPKKCGPTIDCQ